MYVRFFKRFFDFLLALIALLVLSPLLIILIIAGAIAMKGNPFFTQMRPGRIDKVTGKERIFRLIKFRTMSNAKDVKGNLLQDNLRLNDYGKFLRKTSLDELPELINIILGQMAIVGPRPQLVSDMVFMSDEQRLRHTIRPGLTGLAQVSGRNAISWDKKLATDLEYIENITIWGDLSILCKTISKVLKSEGITEEGEATATDFGDFLLKSNTITEVEYIEKQELAKKIVSEATL